MQLPRPVRIQTLYFLAFQNRKLVTYPRINCYHGFNEHLPPPGIQTLDFLALELVDLLVISSTANNLGFEAEVAIPIVPGIKHQRVLSIRPPRWFVCSDRLFSRVKSQVSKLT